MGQFLLWHSDLCNTKRILYSKVHFILDTKLGFKLYKSSHFTKIFSWFPCTFDEDLINNDSIQSFTVFYMCSVAVHLNIHYLDIDMSTIRIFICLQLGYLYIYYQDIYMFTIGIFICLLMGYLYVYYLDIYMFTIRIFICTFDNCIWIFKYIAQ